MARSFEKLCDLAIPESGGANPGKVRDAYASFSKARMRALLLGKSFLDECEWSSAPHLRNSSGISGASDQSVETFLLEIKRRQTNLESLMKSLERGFNMERLLRLMEME